MYLNRSGNHVRGPGQEIQDLTSQKLEEAGKMEVHVLLEGTIKVCAHACHANSHKQD